MRTSPLLLIALALSATLLAAEERTIHSQPSWVIASPQIELAVTKRGAHMAPVTFLRDSAAPVQPYHISPWQDEGLTFDVPLLHVLRGDWFCLPFGGNGTAFRGETHPPHGEVAGAEWKHLATKREGGVTTLRLACKTTARRGTVTKELSLIDGQNVIYSRHMIEDFAGPAPLGHHATLAMPDKEGVFRISTSPLRLAMTSPSLFSDPAKREYQSFAVGARISSLTKVPLLFKDTPDADISRLPARRGYADLLQLCNEPGEVAWTTAVRTDEGWLWFALKDPAVLNSTVLWIENRGRHGSPWNGRNHCVGLEDVTAFFADGLAASAAPNALTKEGIATAIELRADRPTAVNYIQGVARVPSDFGAVKTVEFKRGEAVFVSESGARVAVPVRHEFLKSGKL